MKNHLCYTSIFELLRVERKKNSRPASIMLPDFQSKSYQAKSGEGDGSFSQNWMNCYLKKSLEFRKNFKGKQWG